jgi:acyl-CoA dehydrogenase
MPRPRRSSASCSRTGGVFAFGLSEREHGADIYSTDMVLTPDGTGWRASGEKYYIGNGNCAARVAVFGRVQRPEGPSANPADDYLFFLADPKHPGYTLVQNVCTARCTFRNSGSRITR